MKTTGILSVACAAVFTVACAGEPRDDTGTLQDDSSVIESDDSRSAVGTSGQFEGASSTSTSARQFVQDMLADGELEVQLGKLAAERASSAEVKQFGQRMVQDHSKAGEQLKQIASQHKIEASQQSGSQHKAVVDRLSSQKGEQFDRAYMTEMVQAHERAVKMTEAHATAQNRTTSTSTGQDRPTASTGQQNRGASSGEQARNAGDADRPTGTAGESSQALESAVNRWAAQTLPTLEEHLKQARSIQQKLSGQGGSTGPREQRQDN